MRGGSQAHLIVGDDDRQYVVKFTDNPQGTRTLVNEVVASQLLRALRLPVPQWRPILVTKAYLGQNPHTLQFGSVAVPVQPGLHFGSEYCGKDRPVYDWLPSPVLRGAQMANAFLGIYVADQWMAHQDVRQAVFYRTQRHQWCVRFIDHGYAFGGASWHFKNSFRWGTYYDHRVYNDVCSFGDVDCWISRIQDLKNDVLASSCDAVPAGWLEGGEEDALCKLMDQLIVRRRRLCEIVEPVMRHPLSPFPTIAQNGTRAILSDIRDLAGAI